MPVHIVTDSTADIPPELIQRHGIVVVPSLLVINDRPLRDGIEITRAEFYQRLASYDPLPTTAAPAAGEFEAAYRRLPEEPVVSIHTASTLSGLYNAARIGAEPFGGRVTVIDSGSLSLGVGWQVLAAAEAGARGQGLEGVLRAIEATRRRLKIYALLDTLDNVRRSGRMSLLRASIAGILQIKPTLELAEGALEVVAQNRTMKRALSDFIGRARALGPLERLAVLYTDNAALAEAVRAALAGQCPDPALLVQVAPTIGTHIGPNAVAVAVVIDEH